MSFQTKLTAFEHAMATVGAAAVAFVVSPYGQTFLKSYPALDPVVIPLTAAAGFLAAFYHIPKQNGQ